MTENRVTKKIRISLKVGPGQLRIKVLTTSLGKLANVRRIIQGSAKILKVNVSRSLGCSLWARLEM